MKPDLDDLTAFLEEASHAPVPPPREPFLRRLELQLVARARGAHDVVEEPAARRLPWALTRLAPVMVAAAVAIAAVRLPDRPAQRIDSSRQPATTLAPTPTTAVVETLTTEPPVPTTEAPPPVETTVPEPAPATTVKPTTTTVKKVTTTTAKPATTTTEKPATTTTVTPTTTLVEKPTYETIALECRAAVVEGRPAVTCSWSPSAVADFGHYRLYRKAPDGSQAKIYVSEVREQVTFTDRDVVAGATYKYWVQVKNSNVELVGQGGPVAVACC